MSRTPLVMFRPLALAAALLVGASACATAEPAAPPAGRSEAGMSAARFERLTARMQGAVDAGATRGIVTLVNRRGVEAHVDVIGAADHEAGKPLARDTIFRIYSMSKPITSVAAMILVEEGTISLGAPAARWLPELADVKVLVAPDGPLDVVEPLERPITVRDLLTHTAGLAYAFTAQGPLAKAIDERGLFGSNTDIGPDEFMKRLGELPLRHQPGTRWHYSLSDDVLGVLIERASGQRFGAFLEERIFAPLGMVDTAFWVPAEKLPRLAVNYYRDPKSGELKVADHPAKSSYAADLRPSSRAAEGSSPPPTTTCASRA